MQWYDVPSKSFHNFLDHSRIFIELHDSNRATVSKKLTFFQRLDNSHKNHILNTSEKANEVILHVS